MGRDPNRRQGRTVSSLLKTWALFPGARQKHGERALEAQKRETLSLCPARGSRQANACKTMPSFLGARKGSYSFRVEDKDQG